MALSIIQFIISKRVQEGLTTFFTCLTPSVGNLYAGVDGGAIMRLVPAR